MVRTDKPRRGTAKSPGERNGTMKKQIAKITVYDDCDPIEIKIYRKYNGAAFEIRVDGQFWTTCENGIEVDEEINDIIKLYHYSFFPMF